MPAYYSKSGHKECIEEMREKYGDYAVLCFCLCNSYKYEYRAGYKSGNSYKADMDKRKWYLEYAKDITRKAYKHRIIQFIKMLFIRR